MRPVPDAVVELTLLTADQGGRAGPLPARWHGCVVQVGTSNFEARLRLQSELPLGSTREIGVDFLSPQAARLALGVGVEFRLWEGGVIGSGHVLRLDNAIDRVA